MVLDNAYVRIVRCSHQGCVGQCTFPKILEVMIGTYNLFHGIFATTKLLHNILQ